MNSFFLINFLVMNILIVYQVSTQESNNCDLSCPTNQTCSTCPLACEKTCQTIFDPICQEKCDSEPQCGCQDGYVRNVDTQKCVKIPDCGTAVALKRPRPEK